MTSVNMLLDCNQHALAILPPTAFRLHWGLFISLIICCGVPLPFTGMRLMVYAGYPSSALPRKLNAESKTTAACL